MSKNQKQNNPPHPARKLTRAEKKEVKAAIDRAKKAGKKGISAQETIPYKRMYQDGICQVTDRQYSKTVQFLDINYQLAQNEDKSAIFDGWCDHSFRGSFSEGHGVVSALDHQAPGGGFRMKQEPRLKFSKEDE